MNSSLDSVLGEVTLLSIAFQRGNGVARPSFTLLGQIIDTLRALSSSSAIFIIENHRLTSMRKVLQGEVSQNQKQINLWP